MLDLKASSAPTSIAHGLPFLGYTVVPGRLLLGRQSRRRFAAKLADYEAEFEQELITEHELQCRVGAMVAFTQVADCREWRRRVLSRSDPNIEVGGLRSEPRHPRR